MRVRAFSYLRFSSAEQGHGDSITRQTRLRDAYIAKKGLTLDSSLIFKDAGVPAFRGENAAKGALRAFLNACDAGDVPRGSYLIVESLDRLSRDEIMAANELFSGLMRRGIVVVTLTPEQEYRSETMDLMEFLRALVEMERAHRESLMKSARSQSNWQRRRANIGSEPLTGRRPSWIDLVEGGFALNPAKAAIVRRIFDLCINGHGIGSIAKLLNREGVAPISKAESWHDSYVFKILINRACIGEFQPCVLHVENTDPAGGPTSKRKAYKPTGTPLKNYFPPVVPLVTFVSAQKALKARSRTGGRACKGINNLFTSLVVDEDGRTYSFRDRNYHQYLISKPVTTGMAKNKPGVPYRPFEEAMLRWLREVKLDADNRAGDTQALQAKKEDLESGIAKLMDEIRARKNLGRVLPLLDQWEGELKEVNAELEAASVPKTDHLAQAQILTAQLAAAGESDRDRLRRQVKQQIKELLEKIVVRVEGKPRTKSKRVDCLIHFRDGRTRGVWFQTGSQEAHGLWTPDGKMTADDFAALVRAAASTAGIDTSVPPPAEDLALSEARRQYLEAGGIDTAGMGFISGTPGWDPRREPDPEAAGPVPARRAEKRGRRHASRPR